MYTILFGAVLYICYCCNFQKKKDETEVKKVDETESL